MIERCQSVMAGKRSVIFDYDGTIADTCALHECAFITALAGHAVSFRYADYLGMSTPEALRAIMRRNGRVLSADEVGALTARKRAAAAELMNSALGFVPGAEAFLRALRARGARMFVASSGSRESVHRGLGLLGIADWFEAVVTSEAVTHAKPHPEMILRLLSAYGLVASETIVVEDSAAGITAASAADVDVVCIDLSVVMPPGAGVRVFSATFTELIRMISCP